MTQPRASLLAVRDLRIEIDTGDRFVVPADAVSFDVDRGEVAAIVGESGSGKTMTALAVLGLLPPLARIAAGEIVFDGIDLVTCGTAQLRALHGSRLGYVAQDASSALNPVLRVRTQLVETLRTNLGLDRHAAVERALDLLRLVGIPSPRHALEAYPHELSGGMRQRVVIAIAIACDPELIVADEPTTALDATVQAQIVDLLLEMSERLELAILLISHDLGLVARTTRRTHVMYAGRIVETGATRALVAHPRHPYTEALLTATPRVRSARAGRFPVLAGRPPDLAAPPAGCRFHPRCRYARDRCRVDDPVGRVVACWYPLGAREHRGDA